MLQPSTPLKTIFAFAASLVMAATIAAQPTAAGESPKSPLDLTVKDIDGKEAALSAYKGDVVLIVNTASRCGYTPQYASLETLYGKYKAKGFRILAFPSNDFMAQEPGTEAEIKAFCTGKYNVTFNLFSKVATHGKEQAPIYKFLTEKETDPKFAGKINWNFTKFLVNRQGEVIARFEPKVDPLTEPVTTAIEAALNPPAAAPGAAAAH